MKLYIVL